MEFKDSRTCQNLLKSFAGESQARMRYTYYAKMADKEGLMQIRDIFIETADNEMEHAKLFYKQLIAHGMNESGVDITAGYPVALSEQTIKNLGYAAAGENEEWTLLYPSFAQIAEEEGYKDIANTFKMVATVEKRHEDRYRILHDALRDGLVFKRSNKVLWICTNCGHIHEGTDAPGTCPVCQHPQKYFREYAVTY